MCWLVFEKPFYRQSCKWFIKCGNSQTLSHFFQVTAQFHILVLKLIKQNTFQETHQYVLLRDEGYFHALLSWREKKKKKDSKLDLTRTESEVNGPDAQEQDDKHTRASSRVSAGSFIEQFTLNNSFWPLGRVSKKKPHLTQANKQKRVE